MLGKFAFAPSLKPACARQFDRLRANGGYSAKGSLGALPRRLLADQCATPRGPFMWFLDRLRIRFARGRLARRVVSNAGWMLADRALRLGIGFFVGVWAARYLGPHDFGQLSYALAIAGLCSMLVDLALEGVVVSALLARPAQANVILGTAFWLRVIGGAIGILVVTAGASIARADEPAIVAMAIIVALTFLANPFHVIEFWYQSKLESRTPMLARSIGFVIVTILRVACILAALPVAAFAWLVVIDGALAAAALLFVFRQSRQHLDRPLWSTAEAHELLRKAAPLILAGIATIALMRVDQLMIGAFLDDRAVGIYAAATRLTETLALAAATIASSLLPAVIELQRNSAARYRFELQRIFASMLALAILVALPVSLAAPWIIALLYGVRFDGAESVLAIHVWSCLFTFVGAVIANRLLADGLNGYAFMRMGVALLANIALNLLLIPRFGSTGAAWAAVVANAVAVYVLLGPRATREIGIMACKAILFSRFFPRLRA
jgi:polysaccharide transporter, PST family